MGMPFLMIWTTNLPAYRIWKGCVVKVKVLSYNDDVSDCFAIREKFFVDKKQSEFESPIR